MDCPQCKGYQLQPTELEPGLIVNQCVKCGGSLIPLMNYRYWADQTPAANTNFETDVVAEDNKQAKFCPKCSRLMTKFKIENDSPNKLEFCAGCDEVWLDSGEWQLLRELELHTHLPRIFTDAWQRNLRVQQREMHLKENYRKRLGDETFSKADDFKAWLECQPERTQIIQYLSIRRD